MKPLPEPDPREPEDGSLPLEEELRSWRPAAPSLLLRERIREAAATRDGGPRAGGWFPGGGHAWGWGAAAVAAAAGIVAAFLVPDPSRRPAPEADLLATVRSGTDASTASFPPEGDDETLWLDGEVQGIVELPDAPPMWRVRYQTVRRTAWSEPDGTSRQRFVPEERLLFVPVSYQ